jgi:hypothetical protein
MVNTFIPYADMRASLQCLDSRRLQKQGLEAFQIYLILINAPVIKPDGTTKERKGHKNHPVVRMWNGYLLALRIYICIAVQETGMRKTKKGLNYKTTKMTEYIEKYNLLPTEEEVKNLVYPPWWSNPSVHVSHQAKLYIKDPIYYAQFKQAALHFTDYVWPC